MPRLLIPLRPIPLLLLALAAPRAWAASPEPPDEARLYLSWHAPWGEPGATSDLTVVPGDTTLEDTLYLTCNPAYDTQKTFVAMTASMFFRAAEGDTLGPYWWFGQGTGNLRRIRAIFEPDAALHYPVPWSHGGLGVLHYDWSRGVGHLQMIYAVPPQLGGSSRYGTRYCIARLLFRRPPARLARLDQPVCVELAQATLGLLPGYEPALTRGERFVSVNSPGAVVCAPHRRLVTPKPWTPPRPLGR